MKIRLAGSRLPAICAIGCAAIALVSGCSSNGQTADQSSQNVASAPLTPEEDPWKKGHFTNDVLSHDQEEDLALAINLSGNLCAEVEGAQNIGRMIMVECREYRKRPDKFARFWIMGLGEKQTMSVKKAYVLKKSGWEKVK